MRECRSRSEGTMANVDFGVFDWIDRRQHGQLGQLYEDRLQLLQEADAAGFFCYHLAEHHATPLGMAPSPSVFLAAAAQRKRGWAFGPITVCFSSSGKSTP